MNKASDVARALAIGGVAPVQARIAANQLANLSRQQLSLAAVQADYTPQDMRLITPDARKYRLTNLDWEDTRAYRSSKRPAKAPEQEAQRGDPARHPLADSQPITVSQPVNDEQVVPGDYVDVLTQRRNQFAIHTVGLKLGSTKGLHPRFNNSTGVVDGVPIEWNIGQSQFLQGLVQEKNDATVLSLSLQNLKRVRVRVGDINGNPQYQTLLCWTEGEPGTDSGLGGSDSPSPWTYTTTSATLALQELIVDPVLITGQTSRNPILHARAGTDGDYAALQLNAAPYSGGNWQIRSYTAQTAGRAGQLQFLNASTSRTGLLFDQDGNAYSRSTLGSGTTVLPQYVCRAFIVFNGLTAATITGQNCSVARDSVLPAGAYRVTFAQAMTNINYCVVATATEASGVTWNVTVRVNGNTTANYFDLTTVGTDGVFRDVDKVHAAVFC